jgi:hypothetical protein
MATFFLPDIQFKSIPSIMKDRDCSEKQEQARHEDQAGVEQSE